MDGSTVTCSFLQDAGKQNGREEEPMKRQGPRSCRAQDAMLLGCSYHSRGPIRGLRTPYELLVGSFYIGVIDMVTLKP
jgi:hypothetical protein